MLTSELLEKIYKTSDRELIELWEEYFSSPPLGFFKNSSTKLSFVKEREALVCASLENFVLRREEVLKKTLEDVKRIQRLVRAKRRLREESFNLREKYFSHLVLQKGLLEARRMIARANTPYTPRMAPRALALRIYNLAKQVRLRSDIHHLTSETGVKGIFNSCLFGARTLHEFYLFYTRAALEGFDVFNGDGNVVCLGPHGIDPRECQRIRMTFSYDKLKAKNPCAFFKLRDFGYDKFKRQISQHSAYIRLGDTSLMIRHDMCSRANASGDFFISYRGEGCLVTYPMSEYISYDVENMDRIIVLMFFKLLETISDPGSERGLAQSAFIKRFYDDLGRLTDEELLLFLSDMGEKIRMISEFNFYGAHEIDFDTLKSVSRGSSNKEGFSPAFTLVIKDLVEELQQGETTLFDAAKRRRSLSTLFTSYRFLTYLLEKVSHPESQAALLELRKKTLPTLKAELRARVSVKSGASKNAGTAKVGDGGGASKVGDGAAVGSDL